jgi:hypothetical protein
VVFCVVVTGSVLALRPPGRRPQQPERALATEQLIGKEDRDSGSIRLPAADA